MPVGRLKATPALIALLEGMGGAAVRDQLEPLNLLRRRLGRSESACQTLRDAPPPTQNLRPFSVSARISLARMLRTVPTYVKPVAPWRRTCFRKRDAENRGTSIIEQPAVRRIHLRIGVVRGRKVRMPSLAVMPTA